MTHIQSSDDGVAIPRSLILDRTLTVTAYRLVMYLASRPGDGQVIGAAEVNQAAAALGWPLGKVNVALAELCLSRLIRDNGRLDLFRSAR
jgi:hypothetical protein